MKIYKSISEPNSMNYKRRPQLLPIKIVQQKIQLFCLLFVSFFLCIFHLCSMKVYYRDKYAMSLTWLKMCSPCGTGRILPLLLMEVFGP